MFRPVRRKKSEISREAAEEILLQARIGVLAVNGDEGYPYAFPINFLYAPEQGKIYFHSAKAGHKCDALAACDKVSFTAHGEEVVRKEVWAPFVRSAVAFGRCRKMEPGEEMLTALKRFAMKYYPEESLVDAAIAKDAGKVAFYEITVEHLTGKEVQEK